MNSTLHDRSKLLLIKLAHTIIWAAFVLVIGYVVYAAIVNKIDTYLWIAVGLILMEGAILLLNERKCPLTPVAAKYTDNREANFDIFLPRWLAEYNKEIFTTIFILALLLIIVRLIL